MGLICYKLFNCVWIDLALSLSFGSDVLQFSKRKKIETKYYKKKLKEIVCFLLYSLFNVNSKKYQTKWFSWGYFYYVSLNK